jgi:hypothetical protein
MLTGFPSRVAALAIAALPLIAPSSVMSIVAFDAALSAKQRQAAVTEMAAGTATAATEMGKWRRR